MANYSLSPLFDPQFIPAAAAALVFATQGSPSAVPAGVTSYQIAVMRVANVTNQPQSLTLWRVPAGEANDDAHIVVPKINVPIPSASFPWLDISCLWGAVLLPGDAIWGQASSGNVLTVQADGVILTP